MQMVLRRAVTGRLTAAFLAALAVPATGQNCEGSDLDEYDFMHSPMHGFLIYWTQPTTEISFMVEAEAEEWTAVGFSRDGNMEGSDAVIYLPDLDEVSEHILGSQSITNIFRVPDTEDELLDTEFSQSGGDTIFSFTRYTTPEDSDKLTIPDAPGSPIYIIWAEGMDNGFGYHGQDSRGAFLVDLFCETTVDTDTDTDDLDTPAPIATLAPSTTGIMEDTMDDVMDDSMEGTMSPLSAETPAPSMSTAPAAPVLTMAPSAASPATLSPGTTAPSPSASSDRVASPSLMPAEVPAAPVTPTFTMPPGGFVVAGSAAPVASSSTSPITTGPTDAPIPSSLGIIFGSAAPATASASTAPAAAGPTIPLPPGQTLAPSSGARAIGDVGGTPPPSSNSTGFVGGAARVGGGVTGAAVASAVAAVCLSVVWAIRV